MGHALVKNPYKKPLCYWHAWKAIRGRFTRKRFKINLQQCAHELDTTNNSTTRLGAQTLRLVK